ASLRMTNANGCSATTNASFIVISCSPEIPAHADTLSGQGTGGHTGAAMLVKAGGYLTGVSKWQTIFAEPGSSVAMSAVDGGFIYLKPGASFSCQGTAP